MAEVMVAATGCVTGVKMAAVMEVEETAAVRVAAVTVEEARAEAREAETVAVVKAGEMAAAAKEVEEMEGARVAAATVGG